MNDGEPGGEHRPIGQVPGKAVGGTLNLAVAGSAVMGAAALQSWPVLALGPVAQVPDGQVVRNLMMMWSRLVGK